MFIFIKRSRFTLRRGQFEYYNEQSIRSYVLPKESSLSLPLLLLLTFFAHVPKFNLHIRAEKCGKTIGTVEENLSNGEGVPRSDYTVVS